MGPEIERAAAVRPAPHRRFVPTPERSPFRGLYAGEPENCRRSVGKFLSTCGHLAVMLAVFKVYRVEGRAFEMLAALALAALPVHYLLPFRWKKPLFVAVSLAGLVGVFGAIVAAYVCVFGAVLLGVCIAPVAWRWRAGLLAAIAVALPLVRPGIAANAVPDLVWPVLASLFMFRAVLYLYELKHAPRREPLIDALSYFLMLPNFGFMLFPVIDYRTWQRGYFAEPVQALHRRGLQLMFRGTTHLLLYRLVYHHLLIAPHDVHGPWGLLGHLTGNYLLYLRVSGQFHMACGLLHLFGFQLPDTHHHYLLASSFTDYWRRVNIYWKDFMVRVVFNPVAFRLKRRPRPVALAAATLAVFAVTWILHAYQSFWLRGTWGFSVPDALFWGILSVLVLVNVQRDARRARPGPPPGTVSRVVLTAGTFVTLALLWSLWYSPSVGSWCAMLGRGVGL